MGNRGSIEICQPHHFENKEQSLFLYTHWRGNEVCKVLATALDLGRSRWHDPSYLTRIIFNELQGDDRGTTSFGITLYEPGDNEYPVPMIYWTTRTNKQDYILPEEPMVALGTDIYTADEFILKFLAPSILLEEHEDPTEEMPIVTV